MTIFQIILIIIGSIIIGIPFYLLIGKVGRKIGAIIVGVLDVIFYWDSKRFQKAYDGMENSDVDVMKVLWPLTIVLCVFLSIIIFVIRLGWLVWRAFRGAAKIYRDFLEICWE